MNPYEECPVYETPSFTLRLVQENDANDLLACYSDPKAVANMNADHCTSDFYYTTHEQMRECIAFWLVEYARGAYVRFSIIAKASGKAVGTVEIFGGEYGVLRIDIATAYETEKYIDEFVTLAMDSFIDDFEIETLVIKAAHTPVRLKVIDKYGFALSQGFRPGAGYYEYRESDVEGCVR